MFQQRVQATVAGIIALLITITVLGILAYEVTNAQPATVPSDLLAPWLLVLGYFYGQHAAVNGARQAATSAAQAAAVTAVAATRTPDNANLP